MIRAHYAAAALALSSLATPALPASFVTDEIVNPAGQWAGIDYWGVQVSSFSAFDQLLTFTLPTDSKIDIYMSGSSKFKFTDLLINGQSFASNFTLSSNDLLKTTGYAQAGTVSLRISGDYTCKDCWGDWFGGYVQVSKATMPANLAGPIPEPASWVMMIAGMGLVGGMIRRQKAGLRLA
jgi:hypothetical protein